MQMNFHRKLPIPQEVKREFPLSARMESVKASRDESIRAVFDGRLDKFVEDRYASYSTGIGKKIADKTATFEELAEYALAMGDVKTNTSGRQEYLETVVNRLLFC